MLFRMSSAAPHLHSRNLVTLSTHRISRSVPAPQLGAHMRKPRRCLRGCRPRVTRTPSRV
ncbi:MAG: hypothetical protein ACK56I_34935 [bacterium]